MRTTKNHSMCHLWPAPKRRSAESTEKIYDDTNIEWPEFMLARQVHSGISEIAIALLYFAILIAFCCTH
ncbi:MAG TPA: hypothetical protein VE860_28020 [Chthoniobacterales bacterium]|nr:hypothetical protein [Chthoniobacterales bacterium]